MSHSPAPWVDGLTIGQVLRETARRFPERDACVNCQPGLQSTWAEFDRQVDDVARALFALGFEKGDHFGVWATNCPEWVLLQFATARIGVVLVTINPSYRTYELKYALQQSEVRGLALIDGFKSTDYVAAVNEVCPELPSSAPGELRSAATPRLQWIISLRQKNVGRTGGPSDVQSTKGVGAPDGRTTSPSYEASAPAGTLAWQDFLARRDAVTPARLAEREAQLLASDPINIQYTSGTTGRPKGAMLSHRNILVNAYYAGLNQRMDHRDRLCIPVPLYHCFGCVLGTLCCIVHGSTMVFPAESFDPAATLRAIESERCTAIYGVPTMFIAQLEHADYPQRNLTSLRTGIMAGSPCPIELMKRVTTSMGARELTIGYGLTEASPLITQTRTDDPLELRVGTVGTALPGVEVKIVDPATRQALSDGRPGELCCRGHCNMLGYYNLPEKTAESIDVDGWLHTGDLAVREPNGYFRITGRIKDMIIRGGENVYPREVEERLYQHPAIQDVQVVGVPDRKYGEEILACIKLRDGQTLTEEEVRQFCRAELARFKTPKYVQFVDQFPTTVTGKIQKYRIREQAIKDLNLEDAARIETA
jgi:fatty-acyl-CoA synthase